MEGVNTAVHYPVAIHRTAAYADLGLTAGSRLVAERLADQVCTLPLFPGMSDNETARVIQAVRGFDRRPA
jgi:dTDP-4-amino-4,6-dideoxygalactose transaminase